MTQLILRIERQSQRNAKDFRGWALPSLGKSPGEQEVRKMQAVEVLPLLYRSSCPLLPTQRHAKVKLSREVDQGQMAPNKSQNCCSWAHQVLSSKRDPVKATPTGPGKMQAVEVLPLLYRSSCPLLPTQRHAKVKLSREVDQGQMAPQSTKLLLPGAPSPFKQRDPVKATPTGPGNLPSTSSIKGNGAHLTRQ